MILDTVKGALALVVVILLGAGAYLGVQRWRAVQLGRHLVAEREVRRERAAVDELRVPLAGARSTFDSALAAGRTVLAVPIIRRPARLSQPVAAPPVLETLGADSLRGIIVQQRADLVSVRQWAESLEARLSIGSDTLAVVIAAGARYRSFADSMIAAQGRQILAMQVVIETRKPRRRWGVGGAGGYCSLYQRAEPGVGAAGLAMRHGPGVCVGLSFNF